MWSSYYKKKSWNLFFLIKICHCAEIWTTFLWHDSCTWSLCGCRSPMQRHGKPLPFHQLVSPAWPCPKTQEAFRSNPERWKTPQPPGTCEWRYNPMGTNHFITLWTAQDISHWGIVLLAYLSNHGVCHIYIGFVRKRDHHVVDVVPRLWPHVA